MYSRKETTSNHTYHTTISPRPTATTVLSCCETSDCRVEVKKMGYVRVLRHAPPGSMGLPFCEFRQIEPSSEWMGLESSGNDNYRLVSQGIAKSNTGTCTLVIGFTNTAFSPAPHKPISLSLYGVGPNMAASGAAKRTFIHSTWTLAWAGRADRQKKEGCATERACFQAAQR
jgi:hypothetical protein